jgi:hypothetical protein
MSDTEKVAKLYDALVRLWYSMLWFERLAPHRENRKLSNKLNKVINTVNDIKNIIIINTVNDIKSLDKSGEEKRRLRLARQCSVGRGFPECPRH